MDRRKRITLDLDAFDLVLQATVSWFAFDGEPTGVLVRHYEGNRPTASDALHSAQDEPEQNPLLW